MHFNQNELVTSGETELLTKMGLLEISVTTLHDEIILQQIHFNWYTVNVYYNILNTTKHYSCSIVN
jgi:hypothetical protein